MYRWRYQYWQGVTEVHYKLQTERLSWNNRAALKCWKKIGYESLLFWSFPLLFPLFNKFHESLLSTCRVTQTLKKHKPTTKEINKKSMMFLLCITSLKKDNLHSIVNGRFNLKTKLSIKIILRLLLLLSRKRCVIWF